MDAAQSDLAGIWDYYAIERQNVAFADQFIDDLTEKIFELITYPALGRRRDDLSFGLRGLGYKDYLIFYRQMEGWIVVCRVLRGSADLGGKRFPVE